MATPDFSKVWASNSPLPEYTFSDADYVTGWDFVGSAPPTKNEFDAWFKLVDTKLNWLYNQIRDTASKLYPVGSVYISFNSADPSTLFGGTWQRLKDTFLLASGDAYAANTTGGSATKTIAVNNMPAHNHSVNTAGTHTHSVSGTTGGAGSHSHSTGSAGWHYHTLYWTDDGSNTGTSHGYIDGEGRPKRGYSYSTGTEGTGEHTHSVSVAGDHSHSFSVTTGNNGAHTHTTNNTGGGLPLNIMPPYQTVYMWRRTA